MFQRKQLERPSIFDSHKRVPLHFILMNESDWSDDILQGFQNQKGCARKREVWKSQVSGFWP
jgi:hypothetical protein